MVRFPFQARKHPIRDLRRNHGNTMPEWGAILWCTFKFWKLVCIARNIVRYFLQYTVWEQRTTNWIRLISGSAQTSFSWLWIWKRHWSKIYKKVNTVTLSLASILLSTVYQPCFPACLWCWMWHTQKKKDRKASLSTDNGKGVSHLFFCWWSWTLTCKTTKTPSI